MDGLTGKIANEINENEVETKNQNFNSCKNSDERMHEIEQKLNAVDGKLEQIMGEIAKQNVMIGQLLKQGAEEIPLKIKFPIKTDEDIVKLDKEIKISGKTAYVRTMKSLLKPGGVKNIKNVMTDQFVGNYNVDGVQGKKSLKQYKHFFGALIETISMEGDTIGSAEYQLRKAMHLQKKRHLKQKLKMKQMKMKRTPPSKVKI